MRLLKLFVITIAILFVADLTPKSALASQYGEETKPGRIFIDKKIVTPGTSNKPVQDGEFVDNLFDFNQRFQPTQNMFFRIRVKNVSNIPLSNVQIKDFFPAGFIESVGGSGTMVRENNRLIIVIDAGTLQPDEERVDFIQFRALPVEKLSSNTNLFCGAQGVNNKIQVTASNGAFDEDNTQFCIEKTTNVITTTQTITTQQAVTANVIQVPGQKVVQSVEVPAAGTPVGTITAERIPSAGPEQNIIVIAGELLTLIGGIYLKKKVA